MVPIIIFQRAMKSRRTRYPGLWGWLCKETLG